MKNKNSKVLHYSWAQFDADIKKIAKLLKGKQFVGVWGLARGGLPIAVCLSHALGVPLALTPNNKRILIVDDVADTGRTLQKFSEKNYFIATIFYHRQSKFVPNVWLREKKDKYIVFPWEYKHQKRSS